MRVEFCLTLVLAVVVHHSAAYFFADDKELTAAESSPGVAIIYPKPIGPEFNEDDLKRIKVKAGEEEEATTLAPTTTTAPTTVSELSTTTTAGTEASETSAPSTTVTTASPTTTTTTSASSATTSEPSSFGTRSVNRIWHFNNQGVNTNSVWFSPNRADSEAVESSQAPVYVARQAQATPPTVFVRKPVYAVEPAESNTVGEYSNIRESGRNLYYPDISRIQSSAASSASSSASASASASSSSLSSSTTNDAYQAAASNTFGTKGGAQYRQTAFWQQAQLQTPVKAVRKIVKTTTEVNRESQPVRVRVVVQPSSSTKSIQNQFQNNYFERLQDARATSSAYTKKVTNEFSKTIAADQKEYVQVSKVRVEGTKTPPPAPIKSLPPPPPPPAVKIPRPPPVKSYPTKSAVRAPIYEQEQVHEEHPAPEPYSFNFNVADDSGNGQFRREEQDQNGVVRGSYGYTDAWGLYRIVDYVADANGFRASIRTNEPGLVERNPVTNEVDAPAHIKVAAEDTPTKVLELMRLTKPKHQF